MSPQQRTHELQTRNVFYMKQSKVKLERIKGIQYYLISFIANGIWTEIKQGLYRGQDPYALVSELPNEVMV